MGIKSNLFLFKIKFILCEIACFLWYLTGIFAVLLFAGRALLCFNSMYLSMSVWARSSSPHIRPFDANVRFSCFSFAFEVFIRAKAHQFHENIAAHSGKSAGWVRGGPRFTYYCLVFIVLAMVNKSERINSVHSSILSPSICANNNVQEIERMRANKQQEIAPEEINEQRIGCARNLSLTHTTLCFSQLVMWIWLGMVTYGSITKFSAHCLRTGIIFKFHFLRMHFVCSALCSRHFRNHINQEHTIALSLNLVFCD